MADSSLNDPYLSELLAQGKALEGREADLTKKEAELKAERTNINHERDVLAAAVAHYRNFLESKGRPVPAALAPPEPVAPRGNGTLALGDAIPESQLRAGPKRRAVLEAIARLTSGGRKTANAAIQHETGLTGELISNVIYEDVRRGFVARRGSDIYMTDKGFAFMRQLGSDAVPQNEKTPEVH